MSIQKGTIITRRNLPHLTKAGSTYFVTSRLDGSLPREFLRALQFMQSALAARVKDANHSAEAKANARKEQLRIFGKFDKYLDASPVGPHIFRDSRCANILMQSILRQDATTATIECFTVMSNHLHVLLRPYENYDLIAVMKRIKQQSAFECFKIIDESRPMWEVENYDHIVRDDAEWGRIVAYILNNPVKAGLCAHWRDWPYSYIREEIPGITDR